MREHEQFEHCETNGEKAAGNSAAEPLRGAGKAASGATFWEGGHPFWAIWFSPRRTIRQIISVNSQLHVVPLACLTGIGRVLDRASSRNLGDQLSLPSVLGLACLGGALAGLIGLWVSSFGFSITGKWLGGTASREHLRTAIAWSGVPLVVALLMWIPELLLFGSEMFTAETPRMDAQPGLFNLLLLFVAAESVLGVWSFLLLCQTIAEVQGFRSSWRGFGNVLLVGMLYVFLALALAMFFLLLFSGLAGR